MDATNITQPFDQHGIPLGVDPIPMMWDYQFVDHEKERRLLYIVGCFISAGKSAEEAISEAHKVVDAIEAGEKL